MINDIPKPEISPDFTIDDIHRIREYHYELTKNMTPEEKCRFYNEGARKTLEEWRERKANNGST